MPPSVATVAPARRVRGRVRVPGDKSISHRYALLAAIAEGRSTIAGYAPGADCASTLDCLRALGVEANRADTDTVTILGRGFGRLRSPEGGPLDAGNSGTTMRLLAGVLAAQPFASRLAGDESLSRRPMRRVIEPLEKMGARIEATDGHAPLTIYGGPLTGIEHRVAVASAQVKSAILLAGLHAEGETSVSEPAATRDHTERALEAFGVPPALSPCTVRIVGRRPLRPQALAVPGDFSSAAYWLVAAAALPGSRIEVEDVGLNPTRTALLNVLRRFGAAISVEENAISGGEPSGTVIVEAREARGVAIGPDEVPLLIDELPALAALAAHGGEVTVRGASELRIKESDRIATLVAGMRALGIEAEEYPDGFAIRGHQRGRPQGGVAAQAQGDHRMAMALAIAALAAEQPSQINGAESVAISYPDFFETLGRLVA